MKKSILYPIYFVALLALLYISKVGPIILSALNYVIAPIHCPGILLCTIGLILIIAVEILRHHYPNKPTSPIKPNTSSIPLYSDQPTSDDKYGRDTSALLLVQKIFTTFNASQASKGSFVININEAYGFGKTSFLKIFEKQLSQSPQSYHYIDYRPWLCENEQAIVKEFFTLLSEKLKDYSLNDDIDRYMLLLLSESSQLAPWWAKIPLAIFTKSFKFSSLKETHDSIKSALQQIDRPIIVTIDDVDRLQEKELTAVLKLIRDTADFPNIFYILAADNAHLEMMLTKMGIQYPDNYLKKFFNLDFLLPAHESVQMSQLIARLQTIFPAYGYNAQQTQDYLSRIRNIKLIAKAFDNMRDVVRFLNAYTMSLDVFVANHTLSSINPFDLFCLTLIKHLRPDVYKKLRDRNDEYLYVVSLGTDKFYQIFDSINISKMKDHQEIMETVRSMTDNNPVKKQKEEEEPKIPNLTETLEMSQVTHDDVVIMLLGTIFNSNKSNDSRNISRCNSFYLYFSGKTESTRLSYSDSIQILQKPIKEYQDALDQVFKSNKDEAFINDFAYAFQQSGIPKPEGMKKFNIFLKYRYKYKKYSSYHDFNNVTEFINWVAATEPFSDFLYVLYGNQNVKDINRPKAETELRTYCDSENDINMLLVAFCIFSRRLSLYCFSRDFVNEMLEKLIHRFMNTYLKDKDQPESEDVFDTIILIRDEYEIKDRFETQFIDYITENLARCKFWLGSIITTYPNNDNIYWHYRHRKAVLSEYRDAGTALINAAIQKFPECKDTFEELLTLQGYNSLTDMNLSDSPFVKMALESQHKTHPSPSAQSDL